jgi:Ca2+-binding RTX toxin-like protein
MAIFLLTLTPDTTTLIGTPLADIFQEDRLGTATPRTFIGLGGNDSYLVDEPGDQVVEEENGGIDTVYSPDVGYTLPDNVEQLILLPLLPDGLDTASASTATGNALANLLIGNLVGNYMDGLAGADTMNGGGGNDTYVIDDIGDRVFDSDGIDEVRTYISWVMPTGPDNLVLLEEGGAINGTGNLAGNLIEGNDFDNVLRGLGGDDVLDGNGGADRLEGGVGNDTYLDVAAEDVVIELSGAVQGVADHVFSVALEYRLPAFVENLTLVDTGGAPGITGIGNALGNVIVGNRNANALFGESGNDSLVGGVDPDPDDGDLMLGGLGNDTYVVDSLDDIVAEQFNEGIDEVQSVVSFALPQWIEHLKLGVSPAAIEARGNDLANLIEGNGQDNLVQGHGGNDTLRAGAGADTVEGGAGNDLIDGGAGEDSMTGGAGNDTYLVDDVDDVVSEAGGSGIDEVRVTADTSVTPYQMTAGVENMLLALDLGPGAGGQRGVGNALANRIEAAGSGDDLLDGGGGADTLLGGIGDDTYVIDSLLDLIIDSTGKDTIRTSITLTGLLPVFIENLELTGTDPINGTGNSLINVIIGNSAANVITALGGSDTVIGGAGNDILLGGLGEDSVLGGADADRLIGDAGNDTLRGEGGDDSIEGGIGDDLIDAGTGTNTLVGGAGDDTYLVNSSADVVVELAGGGWDVIHSSASFDLATTAGRQQVEALHLTGTAIEGLGNALANTIAGNDQDNLIEGRGGNDWLAAGAGTDTLRGGVGNDTYVVSDSGDVVEELAGEGTDLVQSFASYVLPDHVESLVLVGRGVISGTGNAANNRIVGNTEDNTLDGGAGADTMVGSSGNDIYQVDSVQDVVIELARGGIDQINAAVSITLAANVENLLLAPGNLNGTGNALDNRLTGGTGDNVLNGGAGNDTLLGGGGTDTLRGGLGDDLYLAAATDTIEELSGQGIDTVETELATYTLGANVENFRGAGPAVNATGNGLDNRMLGNSSSDTLAGLGGNDFLDGGAGDDSLSGGLGNDTYVVDAAGDVVVELAGEGIDTLVTALSTVTLAADLAAIENVILSGTAAGTVTGNAAANRITGNDGADLLDGAGGNDTLEGGRGNDTYRVDSTLDVVIERPGAGIDTVETSLSHVLAAHVENLVLQGGGNVNGTGNAGANTLTGNAGNNVLSGGDGRDTIDGGAGADQLLGGNGDDRFVFDALDTLVSGGAGTDTLAVAGGVTLDLRAVPDTRITSIERIELGAGVNDLDASVADVRALVGAAGRLVVDSVGGDDTLTLAATGTTTWTLAGQEMLGGILYEVYVAGALTVLAADALSVDLV